MLWVNVRKQYYADIEVASRNSLKLVVREPAKRNGAIEKLS